MTPQDKITSTPEPIDILNQKRKETFEDHLNSGDFPFLGRSNISSKSYELGFASACIWLLDKHRRELDEMQNKIKL